MEVVSEPTTRGSMVDVLWQGLILTMFAFDVAVLGTDRTVAPNETTDQF